MDAAAPESTPGHDAAHLPAAPSLETGSSYTLGLGGNVVLTIQDKHLLVQDGETSTNKTKPKRTCVGLCPPGASRSTSKTQSIPLYNILWAELSQDQGTLTIDYADNLTKTQLRVAQLSYSTTTTTTTTPPPSDTLTKWTETLLTRAYGPATRRKRAYVLVNPHAGPGRAQSQWTHDVQPLFAAARMPLTVHTTTRSGEAVALARELDIDAFDIIAPCGGDGGPHEIFRGLGQRPDAARALAKIAVAHVPCGSGNALACNSFGVPPRAGLAALAIVKGVATPMDLVSITQAGAPRSLSFLSQTLGVMAEADLGTEHLRWMGEHRFTYGTVKQILKKKEYPCDLWVKMEIDTKKGVRAHYRREREKAAALAGEADKLTMSSTTASRAGRGSTAGSEASSSGEGLPPLKWGSMGDKLPEEWIKLDADRMGTFFAGTMAWMAPDVNFFNAALFSDGMLDIYLVDGAVPAAKVPGLLLSCQNNSFFDHPLVKYYKVSAFRIVPKYGGCGEGEGDDKTGFISIDGEKAPFEPFQAEVHRGLGNIITKRGVVEAPGPRGWEKQE
ncbi:unnamed protein product [Discula destructiva]